MSTTIDPRLIAALLAASQQQGQNFGQPLPGQIGPPAPGSPNAPGVNPNFGQPNPGQ